MSHCTFSPDTDIEREFLFHSKWKGNPDMELNFILCHYSVSMLLASVENKTRFLIKKIFLIDNY